MAPAQPTANGILPIPAAVVQKQTAHSNNSREASNRGGGLRLKVVVRRLPPALTEGEFNAGLSEDWKVGNGKVDWFQYRPGKISKDLAKPPRPSRAYMHLTDQIHLTALSNLFKAWKFNDTVGIGPPTLEFAPYSRIPAGRKRNDARQGLIDQDPDFQIFLESLTNPIEKPSPVDVDLSSRKEEKVTTTPLIEHLREKKAAKDKPSVKASSNKHGRQESKGKGDKKGKIERDNAASPEKTKKVVKAEKVAKEAVRVLNREASTVGTAPTEKANNAESTTTPQKRREPRVMNIAAKIHKDLGLTPPAPRRTPRSEKIPEDVKPTNNAAVKEAATESGGSSVTASPITASTATTTPKRGQRHPRDRRTTKTALSETTNVDRATDSTEPGVQPKLIKKPAKQPAAGPSTPGEQKSPQSQKATLSTPAEPAGASPAPAGSSNADAPRQAFLKHANASQGITEPLIQEALSAFGTIEKVEIDKRKGFAYVEFADAEGLRKAIAASPVKVAQGAVQVLEKRDRVGGRLAPSQMTPPHTPGRTGGYRGKDRDRGRGKATRGGGPAPSSPAPSAPASTAATSGT